MDYAQEFINIQQPKRRMFATDVPDRDWSFLEGIKQKVLEKQAIQPAEEVTPRLPFQVNGIVEEGKRQGSIGVEGAPITQSFGARSGVEVFSGGFNRGADFGVKEGTPLALPPGEWQVQEAFGADKEKGYIGRKSNRGYGNSVLVRNTQTGETLRFSHLSGVNVLPGKVYKGGTVIGASGMTGNVTGPHVDIEYTKNGKLSDVTKSPYSFGKGGGSPLIERVMNELNLLKGIQ